MAVKLTQPDSNVREALRPVNEQEANAQVNVSHVEAVHFATVAAANNWWRE